jgi:hypothetical protein
MFRKLTVCLIFILQSCSLDGYQKSRDFIISERMDLNDGSAIILTRNNVHSISTGPLESRYGSGFTEINWCKDEKDKRCTEIFYANPYKKKKFYAQYTYYKISAGTYYLEKIKELQDYTDNILLLPFKFLGDVGTFGAFIKPNFNTSQSGWNKEFNVPNFASFEARSNEIVYIGDLNFTFIKQKYWIRGKINLEVQDNYHEVVKYFREKHPEFKNRKVVKRLAKGGVLLDNFDAGIFW